MKISRCISLHTFSLPYLQATTLHFFPFFLTLQIKQNHYSQIFSVTLPPFIMFTATKVAFTLAPPRPCSAPPTPFIPFSFSSVSPPHLNSRHLCLRRRLFLLSPKATADQQGLTLITFSFYFACNLDIIAAHLQRLIITCFIFLSGNVGDFDGDAVIDTNVLPYCSIDQKKEKKSVGELEQEFLQALQVYIPPN